MGNNISCKVVGTGLVQLKSHDGTMRTLSNDRHIPHLKKSLIFLGTLDTKGYKLLEGTTREGGLNRAIKICYLKTIGKRKLSQVHKLRLWKRKQLVYQIIRSNIIRK